jgi:hypothetical protein
MEWLKNSAVGRRVTQFPIMQKVDIHEQVKMYIRRAYRGILGQKVFRFDVTFFTNFHLSAFTRCKQLALCSP